MMARGGGGKEKPIDFPWLHFMGVVKLGFTYRSVGQQYFGRWVDLFEAFKQQYNFEKTNGRYKIFQMEEVSSLDVL